MVSTIIINLTKKINKKRVGPALALGLGLESGPNLSRYLCMNAVSFTTHRSSDKLLQLKRLDERRSAPATEGYVYDLVHGL